MRTPRFTTGRRIYRGKLAILGAICGLVAAAAPAGATPPGRNGRIAFTAHADIRHQIYTMRPDGSGLKRVTRDKRFNNSPTWAPGGRWIAFESNRRPVQGGSIHVIRRNGKDRRKLISDGNDPAWSPDGRVIAFTRRVEDPEGKRSWQIFLMRRDGSRVRQLTDITRGAYDQAWSPDGTKLAFEADCQSGAEFCNSIWVINRDGSGLVELTEDQGAYGPSWSPDGSKIVFARYIEDPYEDELVLFTMDADGSNQTRLGEGKKSYGSSPVWSPNGKKIAFHHERRRSVTQGIYVIRVDGTGRKRIHFDGTSSLRPDWAVRRK